MKKRLFNSGFILAIIISAFLVIILITFSLSPSLAQNESWVNRIVTESLSLVESLQNPVIRSSLYIDRVNDRVVFDLKNENGMPGIQLIVDKYGNASIVDSQGRSLSLSDIQRLQQQIASLESKLKNLESWQGVVSSLEPIPEVQKQRTVSLEPIPESEVGTGKADEQRLAIVDLQNQIYQLRIRVDDIIKGLEKTLVS